MGILNYSTKIDPWKTVNEIQQILAKYGVSHFSIKNENGYPVALSFSIDYNGMPLNYVLPCNHEGVFSCIKEDKNIPTAYKNKDQALRTGWRIIKDWVKAQLAIVDSRLSTIHEVFISRLIVNSNGETLSEKILNGNGIALLKK